MGRHPSFSLALVFAAIPALGLGAQGRVALDPVPKGAVSLIGYYAPQKLELSSAKPKSLKKAPAMASALYGILPAANGKKAFHVAIESRADSASVLYVDANGNGDLTDDPRPSWQPRKDAEGYSTYSGFFSIELGSGADAMKASIGAYRFDPANPTYSAYKTALLYYCDYAYKGVIDLAGEKMLAALSNETVSGDFGSAGSYLFLDRNGDGAFNSEWERFEVGKPFALKGSTWELRDIAPMGGRFTIAASTAVVAEIPAPPDHRKGKPVTPFTAADLDGKDLSFPSDYRGKVVLLDFWATWCGPCVGELPGLVSTYAEYSRKGFDILGISLDSKGQDSQLRAFLKENGMAWRQVYDGGGWQAAIAKLYVIRSIPAAFLVDGDSGEILAHGDELRGARLRPTLEKALAAKKGR